jgi:NADH:ubiquinone oxidoreductase subunit K
VINFQNILLVSAVLFTVGAILTLIFRQDLWGDYNALLMLIAVTLGVVGFTSLDHEQEN